MSIQKHIALFLGIWAVLIIAISSFQMASASQISVPSASGANQYLVSTTTGQYVATTTLQTRFLSGLITNSQLANSSIVVTTASPLGGAGTIPLGGTLALTCTGCLTSLSGAASSTLLEDNNTLSGNTTFSKILNSLLATNASGLLIATSTPTAASFYATSTTASSTFQGIEALAFDLTGTATSTGANGLNITSGCFSISGSCLQQIVSSASAYKQAVKYASTSTLPSNSYSNGVAGVGATLTGVANGPFYIDGNTPTVGDRVLVKNEGTGANNGIYTVTTLGVAGLSPFVLTRALDYNSSNDVFPGVASFTNSGTQNANTCWILTNTSAVTIGTTALTYDDACGAGSFTGQFPIIVTGTSISTAFGTTTNTGLTANQMVYTGSTGILTTTATSAATVSSPLTGAITVVGTGQTIGIQAGGTSQNGYISSTDWNTFNGKANISNLFNTTSYNSQPAISTSTSLWLTLAMPGKYSLAASSSYITYASSTAESTTNLFSTNATTTSLGFSSLPDALLATTHTGGVYATTTIGYNYITGGPAGANPTVNVTLSAQNGVATTFMRSDAAPALDQTIAPTMSGIWGFNNAASTTVAHGFYANIVGAPFFFATSTVASSTFAGGINSNIKGCNSGFDLVTDAGGGITCGVDSVGAGSYPFPQFPNGTSTIVNFFGGITAVASSTIGAPNATTTLLGNVMIGNSLLNGIVVGSTTPLQISGNYPNFMQLLVVNTSGAPNATADFVAGNNLYSISNNAYFTNFGIDNSNYVSSSFTNDRPNDGYIIANDGGIDETQASTSLSDASSSQFMWSRGAKRFELFNSGKLVMGYSTTTAAVFAPVTITGSTTPQLALSDSINTGGWTFRAIAGSLFMATSTATATSTTAAFSINPNGYGNFPVGLAVGSTTPLAAFTIQSMAPYLIMLATSTGQSTVASSSVFAINNWGSIQTGWTQASSTGTTITLDWSTTPPVIELWDCAGAQTVTIVNGTTTLFVGSRKVIHVKNMCAGTAGAITWAGMQWDADKAPTQKTTTGSIQTYSFISLYGTTSIPIIEGTGGTGF